MSTSTANKPLVVTRKVHFRRILFHSMKSFGEFHEAVSVFKRTVDNNINIYIERMCCSNVSNKLTTQINVPATKSNLLTAKAIPNHAIGFCDVHSIHKPISLI